MRNKYFILVLTFLSLLIGQSGYAQDWDDMGWDDEITDFINDYEDQGGTVDYYDNAQDFLNDVNNDNDDSNDWEYGEFIDPRYEGTTQTDSQGNIYDYQYSEGWHPVDHSNNDNSNNDTDIYDGLLDTHNYPPNDTSGDDQDQYPPDDNPNNDTNTPESPTTEEPPAKRIWYLDDDGDGYYSTYIFASSKPSGNYKESTIGYDCNDSDSSKKVSADCGLKKWYLDADGDGYHSDETESGDAPDGDWVLTTKGVDCEESDPKITTQCNPNTCKGCPEEEKDWYLDKDNDGYDGGTEKSEESPEGTGWKEGKSNGPDCDDNVWSGDNLNCEAKKTWYLDNDGDGWHCQMKQAEGSPGTKWKETTSGVDCNDARYKIDNDCSKADPCAEIQNVLNYNTPGYPAKNLKSNIDRLKNVVDARVNKKEEGFEVSKRMNADETYRYEFNKAITGTEFTVGISTGASIMGGFHSHPSTGVPIFSFQDLRHLLHLYEDAKDQYKQDVFEGVVAKDDEGNVNVYILKVDDIKALKEQTDAIWNHPDYAAYTNDKERIDAIHEKLGKIFDKSEGAIEKTFLEQFSAVGISLYKADDDSVSSFSKLTIKNKEVTKTSCK